MDCSCPCCLRRLLAELIQVMQQDIGILEKLYAARVRHDERVAEGLYEDIAW